MSTANSGGEGRHNIAGLANLSREDLVAIWTEEFGSEVPKGMSRAMVLRILAWDLQAMVQGGLAAATRRDLVRSMDEAPSKTTTRHARPGSHLVREWNGRTHTVEVLSHGFRWEGREYKSLSSIARDITGTKWSGPRFFGLAGRS